MIVNALCKTYSLLGLPANLAASSEKQIATIYGLSQRRSATLFETAKKFVSAVVAVRKGGKAKLTELIQAERKKSLKFVFSLLLSPPPTELVGKAFAAAGFAGAIDGFEACEEEMLLTGTRLAARNAHPVAIFRAMTAFLGFDYFDAAEQWLKELLEKEPVDEEVLILPGELPDLVVDFAASPGLLSQAFLMAGPNLTAAALAGCPRETAESLKGAALGTVGGRVFDQEIVDARGRLSSDELADAEEAFCALLDSLREPARRPDLIEDDWGRTPDKSLASDLSDLIMELDEKTLRTVVGGLEADLAAALLQTMTPEAHDRLFSTVAPGRGKRLLDVLEAAAPLGSLELTRNAQLFAQRVLSELAPRTRQPGKSFPLPARIRELLTAILSRE